ncbi:MAG: hypothetical protein K6E63_06100 [Lachnospiraceae bacterium]|nr:hypothetical protein [Lachnospiraceae bacterium]
MGSKDNAAVGEFNNAYGGSKRQEAVNIAVLLVMFIIYALTFTVAKFYDMTYPYAGVINFCFLAVLLFNNVNIISLLKSRDKEFIILAAVVFITGLNLIVLGSGKGAFFVAANFLVIWYLSDKLYISSRYLKIFAGLYMAFLVFYLFIAYPRLFTTWDQYKYNTNTAATFTVYTLLCAFVLLEMFYDKSPVVGLLMVILLLKGFQLSLWHRARGAFIMLIMFMFFRYVIPKKWWGKKPFYVILILLATFGSLVFVGMYVAVGATGANFKMPFFYKEVFSGRDKIWLEFFSRLTETPLKLLTGIGTNWQLESFFEFNVHNAMYNFLVIHGIIVFAGILYFIFKRLQGFYSGIIKNRVALCAMCALMAVFFESYFDVDLIWADYAINLIFMLCILSNYEKQREFKI